MYGKFYLTVLLFFSFKLIIYWNLATEEKDNTQFNCKKRTKNKNKTNKQKQNKSKNDNYKKSACNNLCNEITNWKEPLYTAMNYCHKTK